MKRLVYSYCISRNVAAERYDGLIDVVVATIDAAATAEKSFRVATKRLQNGERLYICRLVVATTDATASGDRFALKAERLTQKALLCVNGKRCA